MQRLRLSLLATAAGAAVSVGAAAAADMAVKAPPTSAVNDWNGIYFGGHLGYAAGSSGWTAAPNLGGTIDFFDSYDAFKGTGSYFAGLQAGYNDMLPSRWLLGVEADVSFPNTIAGAAVFSSPATGKASYAEQVEFSGTLRGRIGYAPDNWLFYATGGLAWSYDQFTRTQIAGVPAGATAQPGTVASRFMVPRIGGAIGAGVEVALTPNWSARFEYLATFFGTRGVTFADAAQRFDSDLAVQSVRAGLDFRLGTEPKPGHTADQPSLETGNFAVHAQSTLLEQYAPPFHAPYAGANSLAPNQGRETWDISAFLGWRLWRGAELWINPETDQGFGLSDTHGVAGFPSGEAYKVGAAVPYARLQRAFIRQTIDLGGDTERVEADDSTFSGTQTANRLVLTVGKFGVNDIFDVNKYAHDPRKDFMNWALIEAATFDYAADAWGYTYGAAAEWYQGAWALRGGIFDLSAVPNDADLDPRFSQFQWVGEIERRYVIGGEPGKLAVTAFLSRGRMGSFADAIQVAALTGGMPDTADVRRYTGRGGISLNLEQQITSELGIFARAGAARGDIEPYEFTDVDRTAAAGLSLGGKQWGRPDDKFGLAGVVNGISAVHQAYFAAGGLGIVAGDGKLNYAPEKILETYYAYTVNKWSTFTADYQFVVDPAYNAERGPASIVSGRYHAEF